VRVFGTFGAFNRRQNFPRPCKVRVKFARPLDFTALRAEAKSCPKARLKEIYQQVADEIMGTISAINWAWMAGLNQLYGDGRVEWIQKNRFDTRGLPAVNPSVRNVESFAGAYSDAAFFYAQPKWIRAKRVRL
jgi:hypothetical protein